MKVLERAAADRELDLLSKSEQCRNDNRERLKKVTNLEDLVQFKVQTTDHLLFQEIDLEQDRPQISKEVLQGIINEHSMTIAEQCRPLPTMDQIQSNQVRYLKRYFGIQPAKPHKVKNMNPIMNRYTNNGQRSKSQLATEPSISVEHFKQRLEQMKIQNEANPAIRDPFRGVQIDFNQMPPINNDQSLQVRSDILSLKQVPQYTNPHTLGFVGIQEPPSHNRVTTSDLIYYTNTVEPQIKPLVLGLNQVSQLSKIQQTVTDANYVKYPEFFSHHTELIQKQRLAESKVHKLRQSRQRYLSEKPTIYGNSELNVSRPHTQLAAPTQTSFNSQSKTFTQGYFTHVSQKFQPLGNIRPPQKTADILIDKKALVNGSKVELSPLRTSKVQMALKIQDKQEKRRKVSPNPRSQTAEKPAANASTSTSMQVYRDKADLANINTKSTKMLQPPQSDQSPYTAPVAASDPVHRPSSNQSERRLVHSHKPSSEASRKTPLTNKDTFDITIEESTTTQLVDPLNLLVMAATKVELAIDDKSARESQETLYQINLNQQTGVRAGGKSGVQTGYRQTQNQTHSQWKSQGHRQKIQTQSTNEFNAQYFPKVTSQVSKAEFHTGRYRRFPRFNISVHPDKQPQQKTPVISLKNGFMQLIQTTSHEPLHLDPPLESQLVSLEMLPSSDPTTQLLHHQMNAQQQTDHRYPQDPHKFFNLQPHYPQEDPFDSVVLEKHIDNPLLTSNRTMTGLNNTISMSLKIVHNKFTPLVHSNTTSQGQWQGNLLPKDNTMQMIKRGYGLKHLLYEVGGEQVIREEKYLNSESQVEPQSPGFDEIEEGLEQDPVLAAVAQEDHLKQFNPDLTPVTDFFFEKSVSTQLEANSVQSGDTKIKPSRGKRLVKSKRSSDHDTRKYTPGIPTDMLGVQGNTVVISQQNAQTQNVTPNETKSDQILKMSRAEMGLRQNSLIDIQNEEDLNQRMEEPRSRLLNSEMEPLTALIQRPSMLYNNIHLDVSNNSSAYNLKQEVVFNRVNLPRLSPEEIIQQMKALLKPSDQESRPLPVAQSDPHKIQVPDMQTNSQNLNVVVPTARITSNDTTLPLDDFQNPSGKGLQGKSSINVAGFTKPQLKKKKEQTFVLGFGIYQDATSPTAILNYDTPPLKTVSLADLGPSTLPKPSHHNSSSHEIIEIKEQSYASEEHSIIVMQSVLDKTKPANHQDEGTTPEIINNDLPQVIAEETEYQKISRRILQMSDQPSGVLKAMIDQLYAKEKQYVYTKQNPKDDCLDQSSVIFNLGKCHDLKTKSNYKASSAAAVIIDQGKDCPVKGTAVKLLIHQ